MKELAKLQEKLEQLLKRFHELSGEAVQLKQTISEQQKEIEQLKQENNELKKKSNQESLENYLSQLPEDKKQQIKGQIDSILKMIETNIKLLN